VAGMIAISVVIYAFEFLNASVSALVIWGFVCFSMYVRDADRLEVEEARLHALVLNWERISRA